MHRPGIELCRRVQTREVQKLHGPTGGLPQRRFVRYSRATSLVVPVPSQLAHDSQRPALLPLLAGDLLVAFSVM